MLFNANTLIRQDIKITDTKDKLGCAIRETQSAVGMKKHEKIESQGMANNFFFLIDFPPQSSSSFHT